MEYEAKIRWLRRYRDAVRRETYLEQDLERLRTEAERMTPALSGMPGGGGGADTLPKAVERIVEAQSELSAQIMAAQAIRREVSAVVESVAAERPREILYRRYIIGQRWERIAVDMYMDFRWLTRQHRQIVEALDIPGANTP